MAKINYNYEKRARELEKEKKKEEKRKKKLAQKSDETKEEDLEWPYNSRQKIIHSDRVGENQLYKDLTTSKF